MTPWTTTISIPNKRSPPSRSRAKADALDAGAGRLRYVAIDLGFTHARPAHGCGHAAHDRVRAGAARLGAGKESRSAWRLLSSEVVRAAHDQGPAGYLLRDRGRLSRESAYGPPLVSGRFLAWRPDRLPQP